MDLVIEDTIILMVKSIDRLLPLHEAQLTTYMKTEQENRSGCLSISTFRCSKDGIIRHVL